MKTRALLLVMFLVLATTGLAIAPALAQDATTPVLIVEGSPEEGVIWRGWPVLVQVVGGPETSAKLEVKGPSPVSPRRGALVWVVSAQETASLKPGAYRFVVGKLEVTTKVVSPPASLTNEQRTVSRRLQMYAALALGDAETAKRLGAEWTKDEATSVEAFAAYGDALAATGDRNGALDALQKAWSLVPKGVCPPASLSQRFVELLLETR